MASVQIAKLRNRLVGLVIFVRIASDFPVCPDGIPVTAVDLPTAR